MSNYELIQIIIYAKNKEKVISLLNENKIDVRNLEYC